MLNHIKQYIENPVFIVFSDDIKWAKENFDFLRELNFEIEEFGINSVIVKSHPVWLPKGNEDNSIKKVLELVIAKEKNFNFFK